jgi:hypothetical protein
MRIAKKGFTSLVGALVLLSGVSTATTPSQARDGGVALGLLGGLAAGALVGSALSGPRHYAPPPRVYAYPAYYPAYETEYVECVRHRVWGPYGWHWVRDC